MTTIWQYWQGERTAFIDLCFDTVRKNNKSFEHIILNETTVYKYLPNLRKDLDLLPRIANKADYIRFKLLQKYGGIWLDADVVLFKDLKNIYENFINTKYDFCSTSHFGNGKPSIWFLMAKEECNIIDLQVMSMDARLDSGKYNITWSEFGADLLWNFTNQNNYLHLAVENFCPIPYNQYSLYFKNIDLNLENNYTFVFFNETLNQRQKDFLNLSRQQITSSNLLISKIFRKALTTGVNNGNI